MLDVATPADARGFIGQRYDAEAGLQYLNARYYDPELGMFIQPDWWEVTQAGVGTNRYAYSGNDPVNGRDSSGNATFTGNMGPSGSYAYHCSIATEASRLASSAYRSTATALRTVANRQPSSPEQQQIAERYFSRLTNGQSASSFNKSEMLEVANHFAASADFMDSARMRWKSQEEIDAELSQSGALAMTHSDPRRLVATSLGPKTFTGGDGVANPVGMIA